MSSLGVLSTARVAGQSVIGHPPNDPWPVLFWAAVLVAFLVVVALAAELANRRDDAKAGAGGRRRHRWDDVV